jgi:hypothetical protein
MAGYLIAGIQFGQRAQRRLRESSPARGASAAERATSRTQAVKVVQTAGDPERVKDLEAHAIQ